MQSLMFTPNHSIETYAGAGLPRHRRVEAYVNTEALLSGLQVFMSSGLHGALRMGDATGMVRRI